MSGFKLLKPVKNDLRARLVTDKLSCPDARDNTTLDGFRDPPGGHLYILPPSETPEGSACPADSS